MKTARIAVMGADAIGGWPGCARAMRVCPRN